MVLSTVVSPATTICIHLLLGIRVHVASIIIGLILLLAYRPLDWWNPPICMDIVVYSLLGLGMGLCLWLSSIVHNGGLIDHGAIAGNQWGEGLARADLRVLVHAYSSIAILHALNHHIVGVFGLLLLLDLSRLELLLLNGLAYDIGG